MTASTLLPLASLLLATIYLTACAPSPKHQPTPSLSAPAQPLTVNYHKFTLSNGLDVVFHKDTSDPVTAVALTFHVGSAREVEGRTGFAHLFEHLLFLESENLGKGGLDKMSSRIGGSGANGSTSRDRTNYFQTVPNDALEKMIWAEADKLGFFINTVTEEVLAKEKQVVKNEKRQSVDNRPYGHANYVVGKNLYPQDHPYNWQVIGSLEDLQNATLQDVKDFYHQWYVPNNATLVIAGDFDFDQAKQWVHKYFDEIPRGEPIAPLPDRPATLSETKKRFYQDNFARLPELRLVWPGVELYHQDAYALAILVKLLSQGKTAPLQNIVVEEQELAANVAMYSQNSEVAGEITLITRAYPGTSLAEVKAAIDEGLARFEQQGISDEAINRVKAGIETEFYRGLSSVLGKAFQLAQYNIFAGDPGYINQDIQQALAVTKQDIMDVYQRYIKGQHFIATSFVPKGEEALILPNSMPAKVVEERIVANVQSESFALPTTSNITTTPSGFDRTQEPPYGAPPELTTPEIWQTTLANGLGLYGIENAELPLIEFRLTIDGGLLLEQTDTVGVANLLASLLAKGTASKTPEQLELALDLLGADISIYATRQAIVISGTTLAKNYAPTMELVKEMLLSPRWDKREFELARQRTLSTIAQQSANPNSIADNLYYALLYGEDNILSFNPMGNQASVANISLDDLKQYYGAYISPTLANFHVVGNVSAQQVQASMADMASRWKAKAVTLPPVTLPPRPDKTKVYFYDVPGAKQSVLRFGYLAMAETDTHFYPATIMNYKLGGGSFASTLTQELREGKGYTYGISSRFNGSDIAGPFTIASSVRTNVTYESAALIKEILTAYPHTFSQRDLKDTQSYFLKSASRKLETASAKLSMLENISRYGWQADYLGNRQNVVKQISRSDIQQLALQYVNPDRMVWLIVGDAATQLSRLKTLGFGEPILVNKPPAPVN